MKTIRFGIIGCGTPDETASSHRLFAAVLASQRENKVVIPFKQWVFIDLSHITL